MTTIGAHPARLDITVKAGEDIDFSVAIVDATGAAQNLSGWSAAAQIRAAPASEALHTFTVALAAGAARVSATGADTAGWTFTTAQWDLALTDPDGVRTYPVAGWVRRYPTITTP